MKTVTRTHKIRLKPKSEHRSYFNQACGIARFTWNWALEKWEKAYQNGAKPNALALKKEFNKQKKEFPWIYNVTKYASQQPFIHLQKGFRNFFEKRAKRPKFKRKGCRESFYVGGDQVKVEDKWLKIPLLPKVKLREKLRFSGKILSATISCEANMWFVSITVETTDLPKTCESQEVVGVDLGVSKLAVCSTGKTFAKTAALEKSLKKLRRQNRCLSRCQKGSKGREKAKRGLAKTHYRTKCIRQDLLHKTTTSLTEKYGCIVIEDLDVSSMLKNKYLSRSIADVGFFEFRRQLEYKAKLRGNTIAIAPQYFASSKMCSSCGSCKETLTLAERVYSCNQCDLQIDRDLNASINLKQYYHTVSSTGIDARGHDGSVVVLPLQPAWLKRELYSV